MKCKIPEISWHNRDPVLSVDIQPKTDKSALYRLASGGTDSHVLIWSLSYTENAEIILDVAADLTRHQRAVNVVKWSPNGELLASGDDESVVFIWKQKEESEPINILDSTNEHDKETWITLKVLRGHMEDIYDLSWAPNSKFLVSGSVDNTAIVWDVQKGKSTSILSDHKGFVQGVAWDPQNQYIATLSTDRFLRIFDIQSKKVVHRVSKALLPVPKENELHGKKVRLYHDDTLQTFFRRLCFSPDGKLLLTPAGVVDYDGVTHLLHTTYIYSRYSLKQPSIVLPSLDQYTVAVKCCPILFKLRNKTDASSTVIPLPYRMIFAIATKSSVYLYDTQQRVPFGLISNIHYTRLTDITWSNDGRIIIVSSTDGFCSLITFEDGELGEEYNELSISQPVEQGKEKKKIKNRSKENDLGNNKEHNSVESAKQSQKKDDNPVIMEILPNEIIVASSNLSSDRKLDPLENKSLLAMNKLRTEVVIDKDIISSDEKFESPEKKSLPAFLINVRRHPRTPSSSSSSPSSKLEKSSPILSNKAQDITKDSGKKATPIPIRRHPRALIPTVVEKTAIVEEAMDAWPLRADINEKEDKRVELLQAKMKPDLLKSSQLEVTNGCTEDICLVYEETVEETSNEFSVQKLKSANSEKIDKCEKSGNNQGTPEHKIPRRVQLKTISTPKSKKQLVE